MKVMIHLDRDLDPSVSLLGKKNCRMVLQVLSKYVMHDSYVANWGIILVIALNRPPAVKNAINRSLALQVGGCSTSKTYFYCLRKAIRSLSYGVGAVVEPS